MDIIYAICKKCLTYNKLNCESEECYTRGFICNNCGKFNQYDPSDILKLVK